ncbi:MAG: hypothetical protein ABIU05_18315 [Nitrospirales bacterium]
MTKRFYSYTGVLFEQDTFQDLNICSSVFAVPDINSSTREIMTALT